MGFPTRRTVLARKREFVITGGFDFIIWSEVFDVYKVIMVN